MFENIRITGADKERSCHTDPRAPKEVVIYFELSPSPPPPEWVRILDQMLSGEFLLTVEDLYLRATCPGIHRLEACLDVAKESVREANSLYVDYVEHQQTLHTAMDELDFDD